MNKVEIIKELKNKLIVSCQSSEGNPLKTDNHMLLLAECADLAGCPAFRVDTPETIRLIKSALPHKLIIGLWKKYYNGCEVFITPTMDEVDALVAAKADIIALDGTCSLSPDGRPAYELIAGVRRKYPDIPILADIATLDDCIKSVEAGADILSTTLRGYTRDTAQFLSEDIDTDFIKLIRGKTDRFIAAEGRIWTREQAVQCLKAGADTVIIGTAVNNPMLIAQRFIDAIEKSCASA